MCLDDSEKNSYEEGMQNEDWKNQNIYKCVYIHNYAIFRIPFLLIRQQKRRCAQKIAVRCKRGAPFCIGLPFCANSVFQGQNCGPVNAVQHNAKHI